MTPCVPFAAISYPIKVFDCLDHTYPPETFFPHLSKRATLQLGPQPLDLQSYLGIQDVCLLIVPSQELPVFGMIVSLKCIKMIGLPYSKHSKNNSTLKDMHVMLNLKHSHLSKRIIRMFDTMP